MTNKRAIAGFYDEIAEAYLDRTVGAMGVFLDLVEFAELAVMEVTAASVLDLGCGVGRVAHFLRDKPSLCCGLDLSQEMVRVATREHLREQTCFVCGDASNLPFPRQRFELVTCFGLYEYIEDLLPYLREAADVLRNGGTFIFTCHTVTGARYFNRRGRYRRTGHRAEDVRAASQAAGLDIVSIRPALVLSRLMRLLLAFGRRLPTITARRKTMRFLGHLDGIVSRQKMLAANAKLLIVRCKKRSDEAA